MYHHTALEGSGLDKRGDYSEQTSGNLIQNMFRMKHTRKYENEKKHTEQYFAAVSK